MAANSPPPEPPAAAQAAAPAVERSETQKMHAFMDEVYERNVAAWPEWETTLGRKTDQQGKWNDYSDAYAESQLELARQDLQYLREHFDYAGLDANGKLSYDLFVYNIEQALDDAAWRRHDYVVDQFNGQVSDRFAFLQNQHRDRQRKRRRGLRPTHRRPARSVRGTGPAAQGPLRFRRRHSGLCLRGHDCRRGQHDQRRAGHGLKSAKIRC